MGIKTTKWYPDTCECIISYDWDEDNLEEFILRSVEKCVIHSELKDDDTYNAVISENTGRQRVLQALKENFDLTEEIVLPDGKKNIVFKDGMEPIIGFTEELGKNGRDINITMPDNIATTDEVKEVLSGIHANISNVDSIMSLDVISEIK